MDSIDALNAKEKYKRQRKQVSKRKEASSSARSGQQGVATQIRIFADNYKSSFLGTKNLGAGAGVSHHWMSSDKLGNPCKPDGAYVESAVRFDRDRNTSSFKRAQRVVKKKLFDEEERKFGMSGDLKQKLRLNNKHLRYKENRIGSPPPLSRYISSSVMSVEADRRSRQVLPNHSGVSHRDREEAKSLSSSDAETGSKVHSPGCRSFHQETERKHDGHINRLDTNMDLRIGKRKSEFWTSTADMEADLSFCETMQMRLDKNGIKTYRPKILVDKRSKGNVHAINNNEEPNEIVKIEHGTNYSDETNNNAKSPHKKDVIVVSVTENILEILISADGKWSHLSLPTKNVLIFNKGYKVHQPKEIKIGSLGHIITQNFLKTEEFPTEALSTICIGEPGPCHGVGQVVWSAESMIVVRLPSPPASRVARLVTIHDKALVAQAEKAGVRVDARVGVWFYNRVLHLKSFLEGVAVIPM